MVPSHLVTKWQNEYPEWSRFLIKTLASGYSSVLDNFHQSLTQSVENRIAQFLTSAQLNQSRAVYLTHEELAQEIGTSRVVVSRILKNLEKTGIVKLGRGRITLNSLQPDDI
ncbi:MAG: Crp/Fnr family transcriptional regulator [bacterium]